MKTIIFTFIILAAVLLPISGSCSKDTGRSETQTLKNWTGQVSYTHNYESAGKKDNGDNNFFEWKNNSKTVIVITVSNNKAVGTINYTLDNWSKRTGPFGDSSFEEITKTEEAGSERGSSEISVEIEKKIQNQLQDSNIYSINCFGPGYHVDRTYFYEMKPGEGAATEKTFRTEEGLQISQIMNQFMKNGPDSLIGNLRESLQEPEGGIHETIISWNLTNLQGGK